MEKWMVALNNEQLKMTGGDQGALLDVGSMTLLAEAPRYWIIRYDEGMAEFINIVYKKGGIETLEIK